MLIKQLLILSGDVEVNPGPLGQHGEDHLDLQCSHDDLYEIASFQSFYLKAVARLLIGPQLTQVIIDEGLSEQDKRYEVFEKWLEMKGPKATYRELVNIFEKLQHIEAAQAVRKLTTSCAQSDSTDATNTETRAASSQSATIPSRQSDSIPSTQPVLFPSIGRMVAKGYQRLNEDAGLILYKVTSNIVHVDGKNKIEIVDIGPKCLDPSVPNKVLMILGQTGAGKSTLINAIVNYIFDIKWEDSYRFVLIPESKIQTQSQTQCITAFTFHHVQGSNITFNLIVIDTPGFGDTQGLERDQKLVDQIREFFSIPAQYGIDHLDGIALTVKAHDSRLTPTQRYIFHSVMSIFGKDIGANIFIMATHADGGTPKVFEALHEGGIPIDKKFIFNNSALFTPPCDVTNFSKMFWQMGVDSIKSFFNEFTKTESKSLTLTKEVLKERKQLEVCIQGLQQRITEGLSQISCLKQEKKLLKEHNDSLHLTKQFTYTIDVTKIKSVDLKPGEYVTNCLTCNRTCHYPCTIIQDGEKYKCAAMKPQDDPAKAVCTVCPGKCTWDKHINNPIKFEVYVEREVRTYDDLKQRYQVALEGKGLKEAIIKNITAEKRQLEKEVFSLLQQAHSCIQNLDQIALKPNPLSQAEYIELLIQAEKSDPHPGWEDRVHQYERAKKVAQLMNHIKTKNMEAFLKESGFTEEDLSDDDTQTAKNSKLLKLSCRIS